MIDSKTSLAKHNWNRWGADDQKGAANLATPENVVAASGLVRTGRVFSLGINIDAKSVPVGPGRAPPQHFMQTDGADYCAGLHRRDGYQATDDSIAMPVHVGTHIDALAHIADEDFLYNGYPLSSVRSAGAKKLGMENLRSLVGHGILMDVCALKGVNPLPKGYVITVEDLEACEKRQGVKARSGTIMLLHTGWLGALATLGGKEFMSGEPGIGDAAARWCVERDICAIGADNFAVEVIPTENDGAAPIHRMLIRGCGVYLMEMLNTTELAAAEVYEFLFVAAPLPITGGTGSPINALAIA
ncbi:MAG: cyclase family protein [Rhizobacter sp.]|nr:cyclase family protein [Rhizobacter sp.]